MVGGRRGTGVAQGSDPAACLRRAGDEPGRLLGGGTGRHEVEFDASRTDSRPSLFLRDHRP
ncbi:hypothetical protein ACIP93_36775 [Streptomyces sp. NPDC088745]|uniref:hypothetical protein n=1 Tax=Streptomyces sp. NPDC088745 TaxID=3365884 RepID=UPI0038277284